jgi:L-lactate dehydrogenase
VDSRHIHGYVLGEHGDSEVLTWSVVSVGGVPLDEFCRQTGQVIDEATKASIDHQVRDAAYHIITGKGATYYGIGSALARIVEVIINNHHAILTVCSPTEEVAGVKDVTVSLPYLLSGEGIQSKLSFSLDEAENARLSESAKIIRAVIDSYDAKTRMT